MRGSGQANYYLDLAREDYYLEGGEPPGKWHGRGTKTFGLSGTVTKEQLRHQLDGFSPDGTKQLVQNAGEKDRQSGWDLTFSAPKSVSVAWAVARPDERAKIQAVHELAVQKALSYLEEVAGVTRRGNEGKNSEPAKLIVATFEHGTSRAQEPELHTHALVMNIALRKDGTTGAIRSRDLFRHKMAAGAFYRAAFAFGLQNDLGLEVERDRSCFKLAGVPQSICDYYSTRRKEIKAAMAKAGVRGPVAAKVAALATRQVKEHVLRDALFERWRAESRGQGWSRDQFDTLLHRHSPEPNLDRVSQDIVSQAFGQISEQASFFTERDLVRKAAELAQGNSARPAPGRTRDDWSDPEIAPHGAIPPSFLLRDVRARLNSPECACIGTLKDEKVFALTETLAMEKDLLKNVERGALETRHAVPEATVRGVIAKHPKLSDEQRAAIEHITAQPGELKLVSGMAGTGKSTMLDVARKAWEKQGFRVLGAALSGKAAQGLEESAHIKSATIAKTLIDLDKGIFGLHTRHRKIAPNASEWSPLHDLKVPSLAFDFKRIALTAKTILVVDEAGMVGTRQMKKLMDAVAKAGAKLVLIGDERQLQPIDAGAPFKALLSRFDHARLTDIRRQKEEWGKDLVRLAADGRAEEMLQKAKELELFHTAKTRPAIHKKLIDHWKGRGADKPDENLIITTTRDEAQTLNKLAQAERSRAGKLSRASTTIGGQKIHRADRVLFTKNSTVLGVRNGMLGTVLTVSRSTLTVRLDSGKKATIPLSYYQDVQLGYAITTHKGQGMTARDTFVLLGTSLQDRELSYVQASRASRFTRFYVDEATAGKDLKDIIAKMSQPRQKELATELVQRLREEQDQRQRENEDNEQRRREDEERHRRDVQKSASKNEPQRRQEQRLNP